jgi:hypothetical protein
MTNEEKIEARQAKMSGDEIDEMVGTLYQRTHMTYAEYLAAFPHSPYCFESADKWLNG